MVLAGIADVTKQKKRDGEMALAREMLANAVESLSEGFALYDEDHRLVMCNRLYRELNQPVADLIKPGMKWTDMLRESVRRGMYADAIGREEEWINDRIQNRAKFQSHYEADLGNGKWHSVSMHPHRSRRLRRHARRHQRAQEGGGRRARSHRAAAEGARRLPGADAHVDDRRQDALPQSRQPGAVRRPRRSSSTTMSTRTTAIR